MVRRKDHIGNGIFQLHGEVKAVLPLQFSCSNFNIHNYHYRCEKPDTLTVYYFTKEKVIENVKKQFKQMDGLFDIKHRFSQNCVMTAFQHDLRDFTPKNRLK